MTLKVSLPSEPGAAAALADLGAVKKGDERLGNHLQSLYLTQCEKCEKQISAQAFLWRKGEDVPYAKLYECPHCKDAGERIATDSDKELALQIAGTDTLHRTRLFERVVSLNDEDRVYAEEAIEHYLPRPLYVLGTILNRLDSLNLSESRKRALTALVLLACDAGNTLWGHPAERKRPKLLNTPSQFRDQDAWLTLSVAAAIYLLPLPLSAMRAKQQAAADRVLINHARAKAEHEKVKKAKAEGYRSRAAYKLMEIDAALKVKDLLEEEDNPKLMLRVFISGGGCSGFSSRSS